MKISWMGGPLDGAVQHAAERPHIILPIWVGPDPMVPDKLSIVYELRELEGSEDIEFRFSMDLTNKANETRNS